MRRPQFKAPRWASWLIRADHAVVRLARGFHVVSEEVLGGLLRDGAREALTLERYTRSVTYVPGGGVFEQGLFPWEEAVFSRPPWPSEGRVLVGGAGGGREALALAERGYEVVAFEPCEALAEAGKTIAEGHPRLRFERGSYAELIAAVRGGEGPLASVAAGGLFDAVVLGWTSLSHVLDASMRRGLLQEVRRLAPGGPVLASFLPPEPRGEAEKRLRAAVRGWIGSTGEPPSFSHDAGFYRGFSRDDIEALASEAGYEVERFDDAVYPHAVLVPPRPSR